MRFMSFLKWTSMMNKGTLFWRKKMGCIELVFVMEEMKTGLKMGVWRTNTKWDEKNDKKPKNEGAFSLLLIHVRLSQMSCFSSFSDHSFLLLFSIHSFISERIEKSILYICTQCIMPLPYPCNVGHRNIIENLNIEWHDGPPHKNTSFFLWNWDLA